MRTSSLPLRLDQPMPLPEVLRVPDGDGCVLSATPYPVSCRFAGIDAPEAGQPGFIQARACLAYLLSQPGLTVTTYGLDKWGRRLIVVWLSNGDTANRFMVEAGWAWPYLSAASVKDGYIAQWDRARAAQRGVWSYPHPIEPWKWREAHRRISKGSAGKQGQRGRVYLTGSPQLSTAYTPIQPSPHTPEDET